MTARRDAARLFHESVLVVTGSGRFPIKMLAVDVCTPATDRDVAELDLVERRMVLLRRFRRPSTSAAANRTDWQESGWLVVNEIPVDSDHALERIVRSVRSPVEGGGREGG